MDSVMISIQPKWVALIASGKKTVEVRKTKPKIDTPFKCYIYCTKGKTPNDILTFAGYEEGEYIGDYYANCSVIGEFVCDEIITLGNVSTDPWCRLLGDVHERLKRLVNEQARLTEKELLDYGGKYAWHISDLVIYEEPKELGEFGLRHAPQSWCYVKELIK